MRLIHEEEIGQRPGEPALQYRPRLHAADRTSEYLYHQLIPYLGNKRRLLPLLRDALALTGVRSGVFVDAFAGSGVVSRLAKVLGFRVICNDWEPYCEALNRAAVECDGPPPFASLGGIEAVYDELNGLPGIDGYLATHYCPRDDERPDPDRERLFFTRANGSRLDAMRERVEEWWRSGCLSLAERDVLLASLLYAACYVSNTSGVFKAFHRGWGGSTGTALHRILSPVRLSPPVFWNSGRACRVERRDASDLVARVEADVLYLDPPYNQHQYGSNYHLLNTLTLWDKPRLSPGIRVGGRTRDKSGIRRDWSAKRRSPYCYRSSAEPALEDLLRMARAQWVLVSYSSDGIIPLPRLREMLAAYGRLRVVESLYRRYRVSSTRPSPRAFNREFVLVLEKR